MLKLDSDAHPATDHASSTVIDILRNKAFNHGNRLAYTFLGDGEAESQDLTYGELDRRSRAIAALLQSAGAAGDRVLLLYPPGLEFIAAFLGCLYAGNIAVPAYPPRLNRSQLRFQKIIEDCQPAVVLTTNAVLTRRKSVLGEAPYATDLSWLNTDNLAGELEEKWREPAIDGDTLAMIQYTSGSTSTPKGVMVSHSNLLSNQRMIQVAFHQTEKSVIVGWLPLYHDMGLIGNVLQPLYLGARCVLMSPTAFLQKPSRWLQAISDYRATTSGGPNFAYDLCVRRVSPAERARLDLSNWTTAFNGAEPIFNETMERFAATFASCGFRRAAFYPCYGLAEATLLVTAGQNKTQPTIDKKVSGRNPSRSLSVKENNRTIVGCGPVMPNEQVVIVDPELLTRYPDESVGEIWVSGPNVARGYWNREQETAQTFGAYLKETGGGPFLRTGDLGYMKNGELFVAGRIKDLIIVRGRNHYPQDIELTVQQSDPTLESGSCAAFSVETADEERLVIVKELNRGAQDPGFLIECIREAVAREHDVQAYAIVLIKKGTIPKTTSGKIQRYECRNEFQAGSLATIAEWFETLTPESESKNFLSANRLLTIDAIALETVEKSLLSFLASKLGRSTERIALDEPLLSLGIDSLTAVELSHHLESRFGVVLPSMSLFEDITITQLARTALDQLRGTSACSTPPITITQKELTEHPLSYGQQSLWFLYQLEPLSGAYNVSSALRIRSALDLGALKRALQKIVDRHDSLRTTFLSGSGEPRQRVHEGSEISLLEIDASSWSDQFLNDCLAEEAHRPFNLEQGPLLRVALFTRSPKDHILLVVAHHIVVDLWSLGVLAHELGLFYQAYTDSTDAAIDPLPIRYADYVYWQRELLAGQEGGRLRAYWQGKLASDLSVLDLPTDRPRPPFQTFRGNTQSIELSLDLTHALKLLGQNHRATLYITLQAALHVLLHRYTAQEDIVVGTPVAGRNSAELARLVGYFVNPIVLRADLSGNPTFSMFLERVREVTLAAFAHQDYPFALLVEQFQSTHDPSRSPIFQVMFALQKAPSFGEDNLVSQALIESGRLKFGGLSAESIALRRRASQFDLSLFLVESEEGLKGFIEYNADLFDEWRIERMAGHFQSLTESVIANPERRISEVELLNESEKQQILIGLNRTEKEYHKDLLVHELIAEQARLRPEGVAVKYEQESVSYGELNRRGNQLAHYLRSRGIVRESLVGICAERSLEMVIAILGILKAGAAYIPIDPTDPKQRIEGALEDAQATLLLTQARLLSRIDCRDRIVVCLDKDWDRIAEYSFENLAREVGEDGLAYVIYTSGSTGRPKGAMNTHLGIRNRLLWMQEKYDLNDTDRVLQKTTFSFDVSVWEFLWPLMTGAVLVMAQPGGHKDSKYLLRVIREEEITTVHFVPSMLRVFLEEPVEEASSLRRVICSGEVLTKELEYRLRSRTDAQVSNLYGPTEAAIDVTYWISEGNGEKQVVPIGKPIANTQMYILDVELEPAPVGVTGEVYISGVGLARGYVRRPELTGEKFLPNGFSSKRGERLYRTGDLGRYLSDGNIEFVGRADEQVKVRGYRIELGEIQVALNEHQSVKQSVVVARADERGGQRLTGYVVGDAETTSAELKKHLRERLPEHMVPEAILVLEEMPLTASGKIDRKRLPAVKHAGRQFGQEYDAARTPSEEILVKIFEEVLRIERVGIRDNFFEIGGHSLLATQVISRVRHSFDVEIGVRCVFEEPTIEGLARRIEEAIRAGRKLEAPPLVRTSREQRLPLSFAQQRLWFIEQLEPGKAVYNIPGAVRLGGGLSLEALERVVNEIVRRHEALRTRIDVKDGEPVQVIDEWKPRKLEAEDLTNMSREEKEEVVRRVSREEAGTGFDLSAESLIRVRVLKLEEEEHVVFFTMHHIVSDGWSMEILIREVGALYGAYSAGENSPLEELPVQYADFAFWQRAWLKGEPLEKELEYWRKQLAGMEALELPTDRPRPPVRSYRGASRRFVIEKELTQKLREMSQREGATLFMTLLGGFDIVMSRYSGQEDVAIGTDIANRNQAGIEKLIGFFVNQLVIRVMVRGAESFRELLKRVREVSLGAYAHQDLPFEKLVEALQPERDPSRSPLFQAKLVWQNLPREVLELKGLKLLSIGGGETETAKFDFTVAIADEGHELVGVVDYSRDLFEGKTIERLMSHYTNVLREIVEDVGRPISELSLLSEQEREQIVVEWNQTCRDWPLVPCIHVLFQEQVERAPERIALSSERQQMSYRELNRRANQLAHYLQGLGVGPEVVVGLCLERTVEMVVGVMGVLKAGGAYLPLDPESPLERLSYMMEDAGVGVVLTQQELVERLPAFWGQMVCWDVECEKISLESDSEPENEVVPENLAYVIYTSGSTGSPKGVVIEHHGVINLSNWQAHAFQLSPQSRISQFFSYNFDGAVGETFMALLNGATLVISAPDDLEAHRLMDFLNRQLIDVAVFVPSVIKQLDPARIKRPERLTVVSVGENCPVELAAEWSKRCRFINAYGPTEYTVYSHLWEVREQKVKELCHVPIGHPIDNTKTYILDERLMPVPIGVAGEIYLTGAGIARGYLNQPQITATKFIPNHFFLKENLINHGLVSVESADNEINKFKDSKALTEWGQNGKKYIAPEYISPQRILESVKGLDSDLIERTRQFIEKYYGDEFAYQGFSRYFKEGADDSYASCGINRDMLKIFFPYQSFTGLRGIDFCFGNAEVLEALSEMGAQVTGFDLSPFLVQRARAKKLNVRMAKVDVPPEMFLQECGVEEESQNFVISTLTLDRLDNPKNFLVNLFKCLKDGGQFAIQTILPIVPVDDGSVDEPITYTSIQNRITPGQNIEEDKQVLLTTLHSLGARDINICRLPYVVASRDGMQVYEVWSFYGAKVMDQSPNDRNICYQKLYKTGDLGCYLPDGSIHFLGRTDHQVKIRGFRIELGEIEAILNEHRSVRQSVVVVSEEDRGNRRLLGYVVGTKGVTAAELKGFLKERLPAYMVPEAIMVLEEMPLTANGKIDRKRLPTGDNLGKQIGQDYVGARTPVEEMLAGIFEEVLRIDHVGISDNFFEIGGHSLVATQVVSRVRDVFGVEIGVGSIFEEARIEGLARRIEETMKTVERTETPPLVRASREGKLPLSFAQQRLWFIEQLEPGNAVYNSSGAVKLEGELKLEALERAINEIVRRHEVLRTKIEEHEGEPVQVIEEWEPRSLKVEALISLTGEEKEKEIRRLTGEEARTVFDLSRGPLIRVKVLKLEEDEHVVLFTAHHLVSDAWSMGVLVREVGALYEMMSEGKESSLPELKIQYADYAYWQRQYLTGAVLEKHLAYWKKQLGRNLPVLNLPTDHSRPPVPSYRGAAKSFSLSAELSQSLRTMCRREGTTLFMTLLAAFKTLLYKYTTQEDIIVGTAVANRTRAEIEPLIGFFVNMLPMRTDLSGNPRFRELLRRVKDIALGGYAHQDLPFEKLVEEIRHDRAGRQMPLFNVAFGVQNTPEEHLRLNGIKIKPMSPEQEWARLDLTLWVTESMETIRILWTYSKDLFEEETVTRMHNHFETLLFNIIDRPDDRLNTLDISFRAEPGLSLEEGGGREDSDVRKLMSIKRRGVNPSTEAFR